MFMVGTSRKAFDFLCAEKGEGDKLKEINLNCMRDYAKPENMERC